MEELVKKVQECKEELKQAKANEKYWTDMLKDKLEKQGIEKQDFENIGVKVSYVDTVKSTMNEGKLLDLICELANECIDFETKSSILSCIKYKPTIDEDKLQELIYRGVINTEDIESAMETKTYKALRLSNIKGGK